MTTIDLNALVENAVAQKIESLLSNLNPAKPVAKVSAPIAPRTRRGKGTAGTVEVGHKVLYRQGRGEFEAVVTAVNKDGGMVTLKRVKDGKEVTRPLTKLYATN